MDEETLAELIPKVTEQMRSAVGLGTKVGADNVVDQWPDGCDAGRIWCGVSVVSFLVNYVYSKQPILCMICLPCNCVITILIIIH